MTPAQVRQLYLQKGAEFLLPATAIAQRLAQIRAFVLDWDGVFNSGYKTADGASGWNETDAMGINLLRFGWWLQRKKVPPLIVISGEKNPATIRLARRDRFDAVFFSIKNKSDALQVLGRKYWNLRPSQLLFIYDDVIDLSVAGQVGLRFLARHDENPLFTDYVRSNGFADYISFSTKGGTVREVTDLCLALDGSYDKVMRKRTSFDDDYKAYIRERNLIETIFYTREHERIAKVELPYTD